jgi:hypothetical protein
MSKNLIKNINWQKLPDAEERLDHLRARDVEIASLAINLQMRSRINNLEGELAVLKSMQDSWVLSRFSRLYFKITRAIKRVLNRVPR